MAEMAGRLAGKVCVTGIDLVVDGGMKVW